MPSLPTLRGSPTITHNGRSTAFVNLGLPPVTAVVTPAISQLVHGQTMEDMTGWSTWMSASNYETEEGTILGVTAVFIGDDPPAASDTTLSEFQQVGVKFVVRHSSGYDVPFYTALITVYPLAPSILVEATLEGSGAVAEPLVGTDAVFEGSAVTLTREHEISDNGTSGWTGTGTTDYTGPSPTAAKYYRFRSTATNISGSATSYSDVIGPIVTPTVSVVGLTGGKAIIGQEASLSISADVGTITDFQWGSTSGGDEYGTGQTPSTLSAGTAYATATIGGIEYTVSFPVEAAASNEDLVINVLAVGAYDAGTIPVIMDGTGTTNGDDVYLVMFPANDPTPTIANVMAGVAFGGAAALDDWATLWAASPATLSVAGGIARQSVRLAAVVDDGVAPSDVKVSDAFTISTTAATLSGVTADLTDTDVDVTVASNLAFGTIYFGLRLSSSSVLPASDIINTTGDCLETDSDDTPAADGTNAGGFLGLSTGTYVIDAVQVDDFGNVSTVVSSSSFEVTAAGPTVTEAGGAGSANASTSNVTGTITSGAADATKEVYLAVAYGQASGTTAPTITIGGASPTLVISIYDNVNTMVGIYRIAAASGGDLALSITAASVFRSCAWQAWHVINRSTETTDTATSSTSGTLDLSNNVTAGQVAIAALAWGGNGTGGTVTPTGLTLIGSEYVDLHADKTQAFYRADIGVDATPRTMTLAPTGGASAAIRAVMAILG